MEIKSMTFWIEMFFFVFDKLQVMKFLKRKWNFFSVEISNHTFIYSITCLK